MSDYTADIFLTAFRRFVSRRGLCEVVYSNCGINFVGADLQLCELFRQLVARRTRSWIGWQTTASVGDSARWLLSGISEACGKLQSKL